ncbi:hypothetical protein AR457_41820 (plasmid) [Streptomyces agglomeratus]|uniref:hypothetical protein n=1 Tax=Streptomyces agglomeratus TaxID=285458 RepID=UPI0008542C94|nr:hypothetical protein [Streptomyces agglomeratus]OEJ20812.1 hypothetical protein AR457_41820 [Streptomyces agglomeratus]
MTKSDAEKAAETKRVQQAQKRLAAAKVTRDQRKDDADFEFWSDVAAAIDSGELKQTEVCEAIGYKREYVRRQLIEVRAQAEARAKNDTSTSTD